MLRAPSCGLYVAPVLSIQYNSSVMEFWHVYLLQVVEQIRSGTGPKKILVIDMDTEREMVAKVSTTP